MTLCPGAILSGLYILAHLVSTTLRGRYYYYPHSTFDETGAQRGLSSAGEVVLAEREKERE